MCGGSVESISNVIASEVTVTGSLQRAGSVVSVPLPGVTSILN